MKKFITYLLLSICLISCNSNKKINVSKVPIKTNILGVEIGKKVEIDCTRSLWLDPMFLTGGLVFTPTWEQISPNIVLYNCIPKIKDHFYCGGFKWTDLTIGTINEKIVFEITLTGSYGTMDEAKTQFESILTKLSEIYGKGNNCGEKGTMWTDMVNYIVLNCREAKDSNYCELRYRNIELEKAITKEISNEL